MIVELGAVTMVYGIYKYIFPNQKTKLKRLFQKMFQEKKLYNAKGYYPSIKAIDIKPYGAVVLLDIKGICSFKDLESNSNYIKTLFGALDVNVSYENEFIKIQLVLNELHDLEYQKVNLNQHQLLLGYDFKSEPIVADMKKTPHVLVSGLSNTGKTYLVKTIIKNLDTSVLMLNGFRDDFKDLDNIIHIQEEETILKRLQDILNNKTLRIKPLYIFIEELSSIKNKKTIQILKELLCIGRHYNIFIIGIIQIATKEELIFKSYFNTRISFKQVDASSYTVTLGINPNEPLQNREFYVLTDNLYKGRTYSLNNLCEV